MMLLQITPTVYPTAAAAQAVADANAAHDEDGWAYKVVLDPTGTGKALVQVYDEEGGLLGPL